MKSVFALTLGLLVAASTSADDWAQWRGPDRTGISKEKGLLKSWPKEGPKLLWSFDKTGVGYGSPVIVGSKLFIIGAVDPAKGGDEFCVALNTKDGKELWRTPLTTTAGKYLDGWGTGPRSTPTVDGDTVYTLGARGDLSALETATGKKIWGLNLVSDLGGAIPKWGYSESVLIDGDSLLCTPGGNKGTIAQLDKKTGKVLKRSSTTEEASYASIIIGTVGKKKMYIQMSPKGVFGVDATTLKELWRSKAGANGVAVIPTAVFADNQVFVSSGYGSGCGLVDLTEEGEGINAKDVYLNKLLTNHHGGFIRIGEHIFGHSEKGGQWICLAYKKDAEDPVWSSKALDKGSLTCADGMFYCYGQGKGVCKLVEISTEKWIEKGSFEIPLKSEFPRKSGQIWAHPVVSNGILYLRDHEKLMAFSVSAAQ